MAHTVCSFVRIHKHGRGWKRDTPFYIVNRVTFPQCPEERSTEETLLSHQWRLIYEDNIVAPADIFEVVISTKSLPRLERLKKKLQDQATHQKSANDHAKEEGGLWGKFFDLGPGCNGHRIITLYGNWYLDKETAQDITSAEWIRWQEV